MNAAIIRCALCFLLTDFTFSCLTWEYEKNNFTLICRPDNFFSEVFFKNISGHEIASCSFYEKKAKCISNHTNGIISIQNPTQKIKFTLFDIDENLINGKWYCIQGDKQFSTDVSIKEGIISATDVSISVWNQSADNLTFTLLCHSCREPHGNFIELQKNHNSFDSMYYWRLTDTCWHIDEECRPDLCSCTENDFYRTFDVTDINDNIEFSCEMKFIDKHNSAIFFKRANIVYNGKDFINHYTETVIAKEPDDKQPKEHEELSENIQKQINGFRETVLVIFVLIITYCCSYLENIHQQINSFRKTVLGFFVLIINSGCSCRENLRKEIYMFREKELLFSTILIVVGSLYLDYSTDGEIWRYLLTICAVNMVLFLILHVICAQPFDNKKETKNEKTQTDNVSDHLNMGTKLFKKANVKNRIMELRSDKRHTSTESHGKQETKQNKESGKCIGNSSGSKNIEE